MACTKGCVGVPITDIRFCDLTFTDDCGRGCTGLAAGESRIQFNALGVLEVCSNVGGVCTCCEVNCNNVGHNYNAVAPPTENDCVGFAPNGGAWTPGSSHWVIPSGTVIPSSPVGSTYVTDQVYQLVDDCTWCRLCGDPAMLIAYNNFSPVTVPTGTLVVMPLNLAGWDSHGFLTTPNITIPAGLDGMYTIETSVTFDPLIPGGAALPASNPVNTGYQRGTVLNINGVQVTGDIRGLAYLNRSDRYSMTHQAILNAGDVVELLAFYADSPSPNSTHILNNSTTNLGARRQKLTLMREND